MQHCLIFRHFVESKMSDNTFLEKSFVQANLGQRLTSKQADTYNSGCRFTTRILVTNTYQGSFWRLDLGKPSELARINFETFHLTESGLSVVASSDEGSWLITHEPSAFQAPSGEEFFAHIPYFSEVAYRPIGRAGRWAVTLPVVFRCHGHPRHMREGETTFTSISELQRIQKA